ncbi:hypothetical protein LWI29_036668 [Acer saccharum]|uniref:Uncharacterized protein n=1 Tax=Acer saccharum TaxID=4024 RepID=A0AA39TFY5_ACESA|nr:hypothetical protein LWI29_036668 [Acer saccharum]
MEATSSSTSKRNINGGIIKFKNWKCSCGMKAGVRISESVNNPNKLYFFCEKGKCNFYRFWEPNTEEFSLSEYTKSVTQGFDGRDRYGGRPTLLLEREMEDVKARLQRLEIYYARMENQDISNHGRIHNLESMQGGSRVVCSVNMVLLCLRSLVDQLTVTSDLKSKSTSITIGCTGDQACTPPPILKCKSTLSPVVSSSGYRSINGSNEFVPSGFPVDESKTPPSIRKSIFPQSPLDGIVSKKSANRSNHGDYAKDEKVHCPTVVTAEDEEGGESINKNLSGPEHELKLRRRSGRQRKSIKYNQETCSNCSEKGHNKSRCRKPAFDASGPTKPPRTCSIYHRPGHNRQTCPYGY